MDELEIIYYHIVDEKALQIRIDYNLFEKNIDMQNLCNKMGFILVKFSSLNEFQLKLISQNDQNDGFKVTYMGKNYIFYNDLMSETRKRYTIGHEIEHCTDTIHPSKKYKEKIADHFSRSLLIPKCILIEENYDDPYKVANDFNVSLAAAKNALDVAIKWKHHPNFKYSKTEELYLKLYKEFLTKRK